MVLLSVTAVIVNKMQSFHSEHSGWERTWGTRGCGGLRMASIFEQEGEWNILFILGT